MSVPAFSVRAGSELDFFLYEAVLHSIIGGMTTDPADLIKLANFQMPYGKYKGRALIDLPEHYVVWYYGEGLPKGELGRLLGLLYEIKLNGLEHLIYPLKGATL